MPKERSIKRRHNDFRPGKLYDRLLWAALISILIAISVYLIF
jgi:hypothetical protein